MKIYLAGYMSSKKGKKCAHWRRELRKHYVMKAWDIIWLDPMNGQKLGELKRDGLKSTNIPGKAFIYRDFKSVREADLIIANLKTFGEERPITGTLFELSWAWEHNKPVIVIADKTYYTEHPFIKDTASMIVESYKELLEKKYINYFYKGIVTARY